MEEKTPEQLLADKKAKFEANPDQFIDMAELIVAVKRHPKGISHFIGQATRSELNIAKSEVQFQIDEVLRMLAVDAKANILRNKKVIITGKKPKFGGMFGRNS